MLSEQLNLDKSGEKVRAEQAAMTQAEEVAQWLSLY